MPKRKALSPKRKKPGGGTLLRKVGKVTFWQSGMPHVDQNTTVTNPLGYVETMAYNPNDQSTSLTDYNGQVQQFS